MATISVNWSRLHEQGVEPEALLRHQTAWEKHGYRVYIQVQDRKDLAVLQKMTEPPEPVISANTYQVAFYFVVGVLASLIVVFAGWVALAR
jgi:hypothetical protein